MTIIETQIFTQRVIEVLSEEEYRAFQTAIVAAPDAGDVIPGSGGLRKIRWKIEGRGKRGGTRIIYYWIKPRDVILLLFIFKKNEQTNLTPEQTKILKKVVLKELQ